MRQRGDALPWGATHCNCLGTCHSKGAAVVVEEDATTMTKFFFVRVIAKVLKVINYLFVGNEVTQGDVHEEIDLQ